MFYNLLAESTGSSIFDTSNNFWDILSFVLQYILPTLAAVIIVIFIFFVSKRIFIKTFSSNVLGLAKKSPNKKSIEYRFRHYTPHTFTRRDNIDNNGTGKTQNVSYGKFCRLISGNNITVIIGSSGI